MLSLENTIQEVLDFTKKFFNTLWCSLFNPKILFDPLKQKGKDKFMNPNVFLVISFLIFVCFQGIYTPIQSDPTILPGFVFNLTNNFSFTEFFLLSFPFLLLYLGSLSILQKTLKMDKSRSFFLLFFDKIYFGTVLIWYNCYLFSQLYLYSYRMWIGIPPLLYNIFYVLSILLFISPFILLFLYIFKKSLLSYFKFGIIHLFIVFSIIMGLMVVRPFDVFYNEKGLKVYSPEFLPYQYDVNIIMNGKGNSNVFTYVVLQNKSEKPIIIRPSGSISLTSKYLKEDKEYYSFVLDITSYKDTLNPYIVLKQGDVNVFRIEGRMSDWVLKQVEKKYSDWRITVHYNSVDGKGQDCFLVVD
jgi:hypothetical protein